MSTEMTTDTLKLLVESGKENYIMITIKMLYEKQQKPRYIKHVHNVSLRTAQIKLKILSEKNGYFIKESLAEPDRYSVCTQEKGHADGVTFEDFYAQKRADTERCYERNVVYFAENP